MFQPKKSAYQVSQRNKDANTPQMVYVSKADKSEQAPKKYVKIQEEQKEPINSEEQPKNDGARPRRRGGSGNRKSLTSENQQNDAIYKQKNENGKGQQHFAKETLIYRKKEDIGANEIADKNESITKQDIEKHKRRQRSRATEPNKEANGPRKNQINQQDSNQNAAANKERQRKTEEGYRNEGFDGKNRLAGDPWRIDFEAQKNSKRNNSQKRFKKSKQNGPNKDESVKFKNSSGENFNQNFENDGQYHEFYGATGDAAQVNCIFDPEFQNERIDIDKLGNNLIKQVLKVHYESFPCQFNDQIYIKDFFYGNRQPDKEDKLFLENPHLWQNFRKYYTQVDIKNNKSVKTLVVRKGLPKLFQLQLDHIDRSKRYTYKAQKVKNQQDPYFNTIKNLIFAGPKKCLMMGQKVQVYKSLKVNGIDAQISYCSEAQSFVIGCGSSTIMFSKKSQLQQLSSKRRRGQAQTIAVANAWFGFLDQLEAEQGKKIVTQLTQQMNDLTLLGTLVCEAKDKTPLPNRDALVLYSETKIIFHSMVNNRSHSLAVLPEQSYQFFKRYGMTIAPLKSLGMAQTFDQLCDILYCVNCESSLATVAEGHEGSVVYLVKRSGKTGYSNNDRVLSITKIESLEYRILKNMCNKLSSFDHKQSTFQKIELESTELKQSFIRDIMAICQGQFRDQLPRTFDFYINLMIFAVSQIVSRARDPLEKQRKEELANLLDNQNFTDFLQRILELQEQTEQTPKIDMFVKNKLTEKDVQQEEWNQIENDILKDAQNEQNEILQIQDDFIDSRINKNVRPKFAQLMGVLQDACPNLVGTQENKEDLEADIHQQNSKFSEDQKIENFEEEKINATPFAPSSLSQNKNKHDVIAPKQQNKDQTIPETEEVQKLQTPNETIEGSQPKKRQKRNRVRDEMRKSKLTVVLCPPYLLHQHQLAYLRKQFQNLDLMLEFNHDLTNQETQLVIIQSFEGFNKLTGWGRWLKELIVVGIDMVDEAVKNQLLYPADEPGGTEYSVHDSIKHLDCTSLRTYFEEQQLLCQWLHSKQCSIFQEKIKFFEDAAQFLSSLNIIQPKDQPEEIKDDISDQNQNDQVKETEEPYQNEKLQQKTDTKNERKERNMTQKKEEIKETILSQINTNEHDTRKQVSIVIPLAIPGFGKTTFAESLLAPHFHKLPHVYYASISNEDLRQLLINQYLGKYPTKDRDEAFQATNGNLQNEFLQKMSAEILKLKNQDGGDIHEQVIFLDKNFSPALLKKYVDIIDMLQNQNQESIRIRKIGLIPNCESHKTESGTSYPFSMQMFVTCLNRVLNRKHHLTLTNENPDLACRVLFGFFNQYRGLSFNKQFKSNFGLDHYMNTNLTNESDDIQLPQNIVSLADQCLLQCRNQTGTPQPDPIFEKFIEMISIYRRYFGSDTNINDNEESCLISELNRNASLLSSTEPPPERQIPQDLRKPKKRRQDQADANQNSPEKPMQSDPPTPLGQPATAKQINQTRTPNEETTVEIQQDAKQKRQRKRNKEKERQSKHPHQPPGRDFGYKPKTKDGSKQAGEASGSKN